MSLQTKIWHLHEDKGWFKGGDDRPEGVVLTKYAFEKPSGRRLEPDRWMSEHWRSSETERLEAAVACFGASPAE